MTNYHTDLPDIDAIREGLQYTYLYWQGRNKFINEVREMLGGNNKIAAPANTSYKIRVLHTYILAALTSEKAARFTQLPVIQAVPDDETPEAREASSELELAINVAMQEMERRSDGDVWSRIALDAIALDEGVERIERAPAAFWPEVVDLTAKTGYENPFEMELDAAIIKKYKKQYGIPIRSVYVPLENFLPVYEGPTLVESYEIELRSYRDVMRNPLFKNAQGLLGSGTTDSREGLRRKVSIVHYNNARWHAYYALKPSNTFQNPGDTAQVWPDLTTLGLATVGEPILLYAYEHNLGETLYNCIGGRFGGWKSSSNRIEGVAKGLLELNQGADELLSQVVTNVRAKYWPTLLQKVDPDQRGYQVGGIEPKKLTIQEGQDLVVYKDESVEPLFKPVDDPMIGWTWNTIQEQISRLGGSPVTSGQEAPGVDTGYHQALQITQSEHLDEKIEQHLSIGAINRATKILKHIKVMDLGEVYVNTTSMDNSGHKTNKYYSIDPSNLTPLPLLDSEVRPPRPVDFASSIRTALEATNDREGKGALLSDDTVRSTILNVQAPDVEKRKVMMEKQQQELVATGILNQKIMEALNLKLVVANTPQGDPSKAASMAQAAAQELNTPPTTPAGPGSGSASPNPGSLPPGMPSAQAQPEATSGLAISNALQAAR